MVDYCDTVQGNDGFDYYKWDIDPDLVSANIVGASYGLALFDSSAVIANRTLHTKEHAQKPFIVLELEDDLVTPGAITDLAATTTGVDRGEIKLTWTVPSGAFAYRITVTGGAFADDEIPRYLIPFAGTEGSTEEVLIRDIL